LVAGQRCLLNDIIAFYGNQIQPPDYEDWFIIERRNDHWKLDSLISMLL
jgi:hypothetical protein